MMAHYFCHGTSGALPSKMKSSGVQHAHASQVFRRVLQAASAPKQQKMIKPMGRKPSLRVPKAMIAAGAEPQAEKDTIELEVKVEGMVCEGCSSRVESALKVLPGVHSAAVSLETGIATVVVLATDQFQAAMESLPRVVESVKQLGFEAEPYFGDD